MSDPDDKPLAEHVLLEVSTLLREMRDRLVRLETKLEEQARLGAEVRELAIKVQVNAEKIIVVRTQLTAAIAVVGILVPCVFKILHLY